MFGFVLGLILGFVMVVDLFFCSVVVMIRKWFVILVNLFKVEVYVVWIVELVECCVLSKIICILGMIYFRDICVFIGVMIFIIFSSCVIVLIVEMIIIFDLLLSKVMRYGKIWFSFVLLVNCLEKVKSILYVLIFEFVCVVFWREEIISVRNISVLLFVNGCLLFDMECLLFGMLSWIGKCFSFSLGVIGCFFICVLWLWYFKK